jgi:Methyltransferase FkbM domain
MSRQRQAEQFLELVRRAIDEARRSPAASELPVVAGFTGLAILCGAQGRRAFVAGCAVAAVRQAVNVAVLDARRQIRSAAHAGPLTAIAPIGTVFGDSAIEPDLGRLLTSLARELAAANGQVDYVKMDVEGAEEQLLRSDDWSECVRAIKVEVHEPYTVDDCRSDLHRLGFLVRLDDACSTSVIGVRL